MATLEDFSNAENSGGLWGQVRSGTDILQMLQQNRIRLQEMNNELQVEITRDDGGVGVYRLPIVEALNLFP